MARLVAVLVLVLAAYGVLLACFPYAGSLLNHQTLAVRLGFYGILTVGVGVLIVAGGIDLSIGAVVALGAACFSFLLETNVHAGLAAIFVVLGGAVIGIYHGLLVTKLRLQPFLVTLCGLFMFRGLAQWMTGPYNLRLPEERPDVIQVRDLLTHGKVLHVPAGLIVLLFVAGILAVLLQKSVYGRYLYAIGSNEQAARYAGIATDRYRILAYVICSMLAGLGGVLFLLEYPGAQASSAGQLLELYAITGAVLGGCSLRGGEGTIAGMLLGAAILPLLYQICRFSPYIGSDLEYAIIGAALLGGTILNELIARRKRSENA